jgi:hypothetical protein
MKTIRSTYLVNTMYVEGRAFLPGFEREKRTQTKLSETHLKQNEQNGKN